LSFQFQTTTQAAADWIQPDFLELESQMRVRSRVQAISGPSKSEESGQIWWNSSYKFKTDSGKINSAV